MAKSISKPDLWKTWSAGRVIYRTVFDEHSGHIFDQSSLQIPNETLFDAFESLLKGQRDDPFWDQATNDFASLSPYFDYQDDSDC